MNRDRLRRFAFLMLAPSLGRRRRATLAQTAVDAAFVAAAEPNVVRTAVIVEVLRASGGRTGLPRLVRVPRPSHQVGHPIGETEHHLGALIPAARAAYLLTHLEGVSAEETRSILRAAGVSDPETALSLALKCPLEPSVLASVDPPGPRKIAPRLVAAGVGIVVLGVAAPVIAVTTGGGDDSPAEPASNSTPVVPEPAAPAVAPATATSAQTAQKLAVLLGRLEQRLADHEGSKTDKKRLKQLRDAMAAQLDQLNKAATSQAPATGGTKK
ncbi:MAG: hypothetical protein ACT4QF_16395 [Sporichthyaceae bacterium]